MNFLEEREKIRRGKEVDMRITLAWEEAHERAGAIQTLAAIETQSLRTKGRHSGWAKIQDCVIARRAISPDTGYFSCTVAEVHTMIERCLELGLVDTKHCDDANGLIQQYLKVPSDYSDYEDYRELCLAQKAPLCTSAAGWWTKDSKGNYPPRGPSPEAAKQFAPVIERFHKGLQVADRLDRSGNVDMSRLNSMIPLIVSLKTLEDRDPFQPGWSLRSIYPGMEGLASMRIESHHSEGELETVVTDAVKDGLLSKVSNHIGGPATLYKSTKDLYDLLLFVGGTANFDNLLLAASQDTRFKDLCKYTARTPSS